MSSGSLIEPETSGNADNGVDKKRASARRTLLTDELRAFARDCQAWQSLLSAKGDKDSWSPTLLEPNPSAILPYSCDSGYATARPSPVYLYPYCKPTAVPETFLDKFSDKGNPFKANIPTGSRVERPLLHKPVLLNRDTCQDGVSETLTQVGHIKVCISTYSDLN